MLSKTSGNTALERVVSGISLHLANYAVDPDAAMTGPGTLRGPRRYLQHDSPVHLFWEYMSWTRRAGDSAVASYSTFLRVFRKVFKSHLQFRGGKGSDHSECNICCGLKQELKLALSYHKKLAVIEKLTEHLLCQWLDRQIWWGMCLASTSWFLRSQKLGADSAWASISLSVTSIIADRIWGAQPYVYVASFV